MSGRDDSNQNVLGIDDRISMNYQRQRCARSQAYRYPAFFGVAVLRIEARHGQRIVKHRHRLFKPYPVLAQVRGRLRVIPVEFVRGIEHD